MKKKIFILSDKILFNLDSNKLLSDKYFISFYKKNTKNVFKICEKLKSKDCLIVIFDSVKIIPFEKKILFISSFLEIIKKQNIKNKIFICDAIKSKNLNNFDKLKKNIYIEIINSFNSMFSLNLIFLNYINDEKKINLIKILKKIKIYN